MLRFTIEGMENFIFLIQAGATLFLVGLIWTIQIVHYPLFERVGPSNYAKYQSSHMSRITYVVAPIMLAELITAVYFVFVSYEPIDPKLFYIGLALVLLIWISTLFIQSPVHSKLVQKFDAALVRKLVLTNWIRTIGWTLRSIIILWILWLKIK